MSSEDWAGQLRLSTAVKSIYDYLIEENKLFSNRYDLFCFGLVYGILHNKKEQGTKASFVPVATTPSNIRYILKELLLLEQMML